MKAQSAMEYLMTYGWAILIIAVVLAALFQLGVFNATFFQPKVPAGACQVFRPGGPGTTQNINLEGECSGELPQEVAQLSDGYITNPLLIVDKLTSYTVNFWVYPTYAPDNFVNMYTSVSGAAPGCAFYYIRI